MKRAMLLGVTLLLSSAGLGAAVNQDKFEGRPVFREGVDRGYYVWSDGNQWHVRWTTQGKLLNFTGQVMAEGGKLRDPFLWISRKRAASSAPARARWWSVAAVGACTRSAAPPPRS